VTRKTSTKGDYLELRLSAEANSVGYGAAYTMAYLQQLVGTTSVTYSDEGLPVRIRVACPSCPGGYEAIRDGHVGATGAGGSYTLEIAAPDDAFTDVTGHRYAREMAMAKGLKVMTGYADKSFRPNNQITRAELVAALVAALGLKTKLPCASIFTDVPSTAWYCPSVEAARLAGIASGYADQTFRPYGVVTRGELASYIVRAAKWPLTAPPKPTFTDVPATYWAYSRIETFVGWCRGGEPRTFGSYQYQPAAAATRAEAAAGLMRAMNCLTGDEVGN
jgi:hypothetical protein